MPDTDTVRCPQTTSCGMAHMAEMGQAVRDYNQPPCFRFEGARAPAPAPSMLSQEVHNFVNAVYPRVMSVAGLRACGHILNPAIGFLLRLLDCFFEPWRQRQGWKVLALPCRNILYTTGRAMLHSTLIVLSCFGGNDGPRSESNAYTSKIFCTCQKLWASHITAYGLHCDVQLLINDVTLIRMAVRAK